MPPKPFEIPSLLPAAAPSSASRSGIVSTHSRHPGQSDVPSSGTLRHGLQSGSAHLRCAMRTEGVDRRERPALRGSFVRGLTSQFSCSLTVQFVVNRLSQIGFPSGISHKGMTMKKLLTPTTGLVAIVLAWMIGIPAQAYEAGAVAGGGTIEGKVIFNGAVETRKIIPNKDLQVCDGPRDEPLIDVGPDKGVQ